MSQRPSPRTQWHHLLASLLQELLHRVHIQVDTDVQVSGEPPRADIILLQRLSASSWTPEQRQYLPDGIRDSQASHILIEFKYTESLTLEALLRLIGYDTFYRQARSLQRNELQSFMVCAKTPITKMRIRFGFQPLDMAGVYQSDNILLTHIPLIVLNELSNEPHNAFFKLFSSQKRAKDAAMNNINLRWQTLPDKIYWLVYGLMKLWRQKGNIMSDVITPEDLMEEGKALAASFLRGLDKVQLETYLKDNPNFKEIKDEGKAEAIIRNIALILRARFNDLPENLAESLQALSLEELDTLIEAAITSENLEAFNTTLSDYLI